METRHRLDIKFQRVCYDTNITMVSYSAFSNLRYNFQTYVTYLIIKVKRRVIKVKRCVQLVKRISSTVNCNFKNRRTQIGQLFTVASSVEELLVTGIPYPTQSRLTSYTTIKCSVVQVKRRVQLVKNCCQTFAKSTKCSWRSKYQRNQSSRQFQSSLLRGLAILSFLFAEIISK